MATKNSSSSSLLFASLGILLFIAGSIAGFLVWKKIGSNDQNDSPAYVNLGNVVTQVGGGRYVRTNVQLEIKNQQASKLFDADGERVLESVRYGISSASNRDIYSLESKYMMQEAIMGYINDHFGRSVVKAVYFSDFLVTSG